jgi:SAM-dependent methyltransferase
LELRISDEEEPMAGGSHIRYGIYRCDQIEIAGWVDDGAALSSVDIHINDEWVCSLRPDLHREDLEQAGLGDGQRAFAFPLTGRLRAGENVIAILQSGGVLARRVIQYGDPTSHAATPAAARLSQERWRGDEPPAGLTWGRIMTGDSLWDIYQRARRFQGADRIVEFGPGYGRLIRTAIERKIPFASFVGVDLSQTRVAQLKAEFGSDPRCTFVRGDVNTWTADGQIDAVLCSSTFEHLYPDCRQALLNLRKQLAKGALVFIDFIKSDRNDRGFDPDGRTYVCFYPVDKLSLLFSDCGYVVQKVEECRLGIGANGPIDRLVVIAEPDVAR